MQEYGLIGEQLSHSYSAELFNNKFLNEKIPAKYFLFELKDIIEFPELIKQHPNLIGLNVTVPYKRSIIPYLDKLDIPAEVIGAVNTIKINRDGDKIELIGYNTDYLGFAQSIRPFLAIEHERALILGTGGSARAVAYALKNIGIDSTFVSRTRHINHNTISYHQLNEYIFNTHLLIVNATPVGMYPNQNNIPQIPFEYINSNHLVFDLIYNPEKTPFLYKAEERGASVMNGLQMLYFQAEHAWKIWS